MKNILLLVLPSNSPRVVSKYDSPDLFSPSFTKNILKKEINAAMLLGHVDYSLQKVKKRDTLHGLWHYNQQNKYQLFSAFVLGG